MQKFSYIAASVNYNHHNLTDAMIRSVKKNLKIINLSKFIIVDNSDNGTLYNSKFNDITVLDNSHEQLCNLCKNQIIESSYKTLTTPFGGDQNHSLTIQWLLDNCQSDFLILLDSDIILKKDLDFLEDQSYLTCCDIQCIENYDQKRLVSRFLPMLQIFNLKMFRQLQKSIGLKYYEGFFTGETFLHRVLAHNLPFKRICLQNYAEHFGAGSTSTKSLNSELKWIQDNSKYLM